MKQEPVKLTMTNEDDTGSKPNNNCNSSQNFVPPDGGARVRFFLFLKT